MVRTYNHPTSTLTLSDSRGYSPQKKPQSRGGLIQPTTTTAVPNGLTSIPEPSTIPSTIGLDPNAFLTGFPPTLDSLPSYQTFVPQSMLVPMPYAYPPLAQFQTPMQLQYEQLLQLKRLEEEKYRQSLGATNIYSSDQSVPLKPYRFLGDLQNISSSLVDSTSLRSNSAPTTDIDKLSRELQILQQLKQESQVVQQPQQQHQSVVNQSSSTKVLEKRKNSPFTEELPPWLRGNPQPNTGVRGAPNWLQSQTTLNTKTSSTPPDLRREKSLPLNFSFGKSAAIAAEIQRLNNDLNSIGQSELSSTETNKLQRQMEQIVAAHNLKLQEGTPAVFNNQKEPNEPDFFDNFGKGGCGAAMRDPLGKPITDRRILRMSWNGGSLSDILAAQAANNKSLNDSINGRFAPEHSLTEASRTLSQPALPLVVKSKDEEYKEELKRQIEEKKRQKELEAERQKKEDEKDRLRIEKEMDRIAQEEAEEKLKQMEKRKLAERKQAELDMAYRQAAEAAKQLKDSGNKLAKTKNPVVKTPISRRTTAESPHLEWWEKKPDYNDRPESIAHRTNRQESPQILIVSHKNDPTPPESNRHRVAVKQTKKPPSTASSTVTYQSVKPSRRTKSPTMSTVTAESNDIAENEALLHQISAMRQRLQKEQIRVQNAIRRQEANKHQRLASEGELDTDDADTIRSIPVIKSNPGRKGAHKANVTRQPTDQSIGKQSISSSLSAADRIIRSRKAQQSPKLRSSQSSLSIDKDHSAMRSSRMSHRNSSIGDLRGFQ